MEDATFDELRRDVEDVETEIRRQFKSAAWTPVHTDRITATEKEVSEDEQVPDSGLQRDGGRGSNDEN